MYKEKTTAKIDKCVLNLNICKNPQKGKTLISRQIEYFVLVKK